MSERQAAELRRRFREVHTAADAVALLDDARGILEGAELAEFVDEWAFAVGTPTGAFEMLSARDEKGMPDEPVEKVEPDAEDPGLPPDDPELAALLADPEEARNAVDGAVRSGVADGMAGLARDVDLAVAMRVRRAEDE